MRSWSARQQMSACQQSRLVHALLPTDMPALHFCKALASPSATGRWPESTCGGISVSPVTLNIVVLVVASLCDRSGLLLLQAYSPAHLTSSYAKERWRQATLRRIAIEMFGGRWTLC